MTTKPCMGVVSIRRFMRDANITPNRQIKQIKSEKERPQIIAHKAIKPKIFCQTVREKNAYILGWPEKFSYYNFDAKYIRCVLNLFKYSFSILIRASKLHWRLISVDFWEIFYDSVASNGHKIKFVFQQIPSFLTNKQS